MAVAAAGPDANLAMLMLPHEERCRWLKEADEGLEELFRCLGLPGKSAAGILTWDRDADLTPRYSFYDWELNPVLSDLGSMIVPINARYLLLIDVASTSAHANLCYGERRLYDLTTGEIISEDDLFAKGFQPGVTKLLADALETYLADNDDDPEMLFSAPEPNGNFSVSDTHVTWIYNPYEIAPYAMGSIELSVSWNDLKPYLK